MGSQGISVERVTILDLAREAGVSRATVNRVLSGKSSVKRETVEHILAVADRINFYGAKAIHNRMAQRKSQMRLGILLQQRSMPFHAELGARIAAYAAGWTEEQLSVRIEHMDDLTPSLVARRLRALGADCDAVAVASADHPSLAAAIQSLSEDGKPVFTVISDLSAVAKAGYVGIDNRRLGRAAGWYVHRLNRPGKGIAMLVGTHRHLCQEQREMGFRSYLREHDPELEISESLTFESDQGAYEATLDILGRGEAVGALFVVGGGIRGALRALAESAPAAPPVVVAVELNGETRDALIAGTLTVVLAHPLPDIASTLIRNMVEALRNSGASLPITSLLPFQTAISEQIDPSMP